MIRTVTLLSLVAYASAFNLFGDGIWEGGLRVRFDVTVFGLGTTAFIEVPQSNASAVQKKWEQITNPNLHAGYEALSTWCPKEKYTLCALYDDTGYIAGIQIALNEAKLSGSTFDWTVQGFKLWTINNTDGTVENYWTTQQYFITPETLATNQAIRINTRNSKLMLQDKEIVVSGFNRDLYRISTNVSDITGADSDFTKQACLPWMGQHYYYNTTVDLECKADTLFPWFPLVYSEQLIGLGLIAYGKYTYDEGETKWFETPAKLAVKAIVPTGPQCLYDLADSPGLITMHTYFIEKPRQVSCLF